MLPYYPNLDLGCFPVCLFFCVWSVTVGGRRVTSVVVGSLQLLRSFTHDAKKYDPKFGTMLRSNAHFYSDEC